MSNAWVTCLVQGDNSWKRLLIPVSYTHLDVYKRQAVACLGQVLYEQGRAENAADHKPEYLRLSQAERELSLIHI